MNNGPLGKSPVFDWHPPQWAFSHVMCSYTMEHFVQRFEHSTDPCFAELYNANMFYWKNSLLKYKDRWHNTGQFWMNGTDTRHRRHSIVQWVQQQCEPDSGTLLPFRFQPNSRPWYTAHGSPPTSWIESSKCFELGSRAAMFFVDWKNGPKTNKQILFGGFLNLINPKCTIIKHRRIYPNGMEGGLSLDPFPKDGAPKKPSGEVTRWLSIARSGNSLVHPLKQGCQTHFHRGPHQHHGRLLKGRCTWSSV